MILRTQFCTFESRLELQPLTLTAICANTVRIGGVEVLVHPKIHVHYQDSNYLTSESPKAKLSGVVGFHNKPTCHNSFLMQAVPHATYLKPFVSLE